MCVWTRKCNCKSTRKVVQKGKDKEEDKNRGKTVRGEKEGEEDLHLLALHPGGDRGGTYWRIY